ncbi:MAG: hypothetical protein CMB79_08015 [Filomicrobium sp.]|nr:hypothetical protein [Filomicrobium sp.]
MRRPFSQFARLFCRADVEVNGLELSSRHQVWSQTFVDHRQWRPRTRSFRMESPFNLLTLFAGTRILLYSISLETDSRVRWMRQPLPYETIGH